MRGTSRAGFTEIKSSPTPNLKTHLLLTLWQTNIHHEIGEECKPCWGVSEGCAGVSTAFVLANHSEIYRDGFLGAEKVGQFDMR